MSKSDIETWQTFLKDKGFYTGGLDGDFGPGTRRASFEFANESDPTVGVSVGTSGNNLLIMANQKAIRDKAITVNLKSKIQEAVTAVYGNVDKIVVYSGGQDRKGTGNRRTGSVRHDDFGKGGRAADLYVYKNGQKIVGVELAKLGRYWLLSGFGGCGLEMATGGIHLDEWVTPPAGGGMFWTYTYSDGKSWGAEVHSMLAQGAQGKIA